MNLSIFSGPDGTPLASRDELAELSELEKTVSFGGRTLSSASALRAFDEEKNYVRGSPVIEPSLSCDRSTFHLLITETEEYALGLLDLRDLDNIFPTAVEEAFAELLMKGSIEESESSIVYFHSQNFASCPFSEEITSAVCGAHKSFFIRNAASALIDPIESPGHFAATLRGAYRLATPKHRFLELYRCLESLFLGAILRRLTLEFSGDPRSALDRAQKSVQAERNQLFELLLDRGQDVQLKAFNRKIINEADAGNSFASALCDYRKNFAEKSSRNTNDGIWHGCVLLYQIRCAIAHAGTSGLVYEAFSDAEPLVLSLIDYLEEMVWHVIGFSE